MDHFLGVALQTSGKETGESSAILAPAPYNPQVSLFSILQLLNSYLYHHKRCQSQTRKSLDFTDLYVFKYFCKVRPLSINLTTTNTEPLCSQRQPLRGKQQEQHYLNYTALTLTIHKIFNKNTICNLFSREIKLS